MSLFFNRARASSQGGGEVQKPRAHLNLRESLELSPWEKYRLHGKFPWKMLLHLFLVALISIQVCMQGSDASRC